MIDYDKLKARPITMIIAKLQAHIMGIQETQLDLIKIVAHELNYPQDILIKAMMLASNNMEINK